MNKEIAIKNLLKGVQQLQMHQHELEKIKGETFNIFTILGVETKENKTHSSFIAALLNPAGSHFMGTVFLQEFLDQVNYSGSLDINTATVVKEHHIGKISDVSGGRIDILIKDASDNLISIENKVYAGDQENQLIRYHNFHREKNTLYYLTLRGEAATDRSTIHKDEAVDIFLENGIHYHTLSYASDMLKWLDKCHKLAVDVPQVRDSIKQYILLIRKLTNQMVDPKNAEIKKTLFKYAQEAQFIADYFQTIKNEIKERFRSDVASRLKSVAGESLYQFKTPNDVRKKGYAQIFVELKKYPESKIIFSIESFSGYGNLNNCMYIGVFDVSGKRESYPISGDTTGLITTWWKSAKLIKINNQHICLENPLFLKELVDPSSHEYQEIVDAFVTQCLDFIKDNYPTIEDYLSKEAIS